MDAGSRPPVRPLPPTLPVPAEIRPLPAPTTPTAAAGLTPEDVYRVEPSTPAPPPDVRTDARVPEKGLGWEGAQPEGLRPLEHVFRTLQGHLFPAAALLRTPRPSTQATEVNREVALSELRTALQEVADLPLPAPLAEGASMSEQYAAAEVCAAAESVLMGYVQLTGWLDTREPACRQALECTEALSGRVDLGRLFETAFLAGDITGAMGVARTARATTRSNVRQQACAWDLFLTLRELVRANRPDGVATTLFLRGHLEDDRLAEPSAQLFPVLQAAPHLRGPMLLAVLRKHFASEPAAELLLTGPLESRREGHWRDTAQQGRTLLEPVVRPLMALTSNAQKILRELTRAEDQLAHREAHFHALAVGHRPQARAEAHDRVSEARERHAHLIHLRDHSPELLDAIAVMEGFRTSLLRHSPVSPEAASLAATALAALPPAEPETGAFALRSTLAEAIQMVGGPLVSGIQALVVGAALGERGPARRILRIPQHVEARDAQVRALFHELGVFHQWFLGPDGDRMAADLRHDQSDGRGPQRVLTPDPDYPWRRKTLLRCEGTYISSLAGRMFPDPGPNQQQEVALGWRTEVLSVGVATLADPARMLLAYCDAEAHLAFTLGTLAPRQPFNEG